MWGEWGEGGEDATGTRLNDDEYNVTDRWVGPGHGIGGLIGRMGRSGQEDGWEEFEGRPSYIGTMGEIVAPFIGYPDVCLRAETETETETDTDTLTCVVCLIDNNDTDCMEKVVINSVCDTCVYGVHDSCFAAWYGKCGKCIICRNRLLCIAGDESDDSDGDDDVDPVSLGLVNIIRIQGDSGGRIPHNNGFHGQWGYFSMNYVVIRAKRICMMLCTFAVGVAVYSAIWTLIYIDNILRGGWRWDGDGVGWDGGGVGWDGDECV